MKLYDGGKFPSAYTKAYRYINDDYTKIFKFPGTGGETIYYEKKWCGPYSNSALYKWYWKENIWVNYSQHVYFGIPIKSYENYIWYPPSLFCRKIFYNILGRLCHLLTDMGVPEHAKRSMHISTGASPFEHWLRDGAYDNEFKWTAEKVYNEMGGFVNPFCKVWNDKNSFLFYTLAQLSDWFVSYGTLLKSGNDNYDHNIGEINSLIKSYAPEDPRFSYNSGEGTSNGIKEVGWVIGNDEGRIYRDVLLPYTIRAVAGLLYKYIIETKMQFPEATENEKGSIYDQQQELDLFNQDINGDYYTFRAEGSPGRITVCSDNKPVGYPADFNIGPFARNVTFRASKEIVFKSGFSARKGSQVHAYIVPGCSETNQSGNCGECLDEDFNPQYDR